MIDTNYKYAQWSTNVNTSGMNWQTYHEGKWYNPATQSYDEAIEEMKEEIRQKVLKDHPHLIAFKTNFDEVIQVSQNKKVVCDTPAPSHEWTGTPNIAPYEKINRGTIEEQIDKNFNLIEEINKCTNPNVFRSQKYLCKTKEEHAAWDERNKEAFGGKL